MVESHDHCQAARAQERSEQAAIDAATPLNLLADPGIPHPVTVLCDDSEGDADEEGCASRSYFPVGWPTAASAVVQFNGDGPLHRGERYAPLAHQRLRLALDQVFRVALEEEAASRVAALLFGA